jgi:23S rRNA (uridine2552-2'-O)-methyltransferase
MRRHVGDPYVRRASTEGYRSRAAYKLIEIAARDRLFRPGMTVIDLGAAPGGWSQVAAAAVGPEGRVIAVDQLEMEPVAGVAFVRGDFQDQAVVAEVIRLLDRRRADLVMSDLSPNISGIAGTDQARAAALLDLAWEFAVNYLKPDGNFLIKAFQGSAFHAQVVGLRRCFRQVLVRKPKASRSESREVYLLAKGRKAG